MRLIALKTLTGLLAAAALAACSTLEEDKVNYKSASTGPGLEVPPDLTQLRRDSRYALESSSASAAGFVTAQRTARDLGTAANSLGDVRMERSGNQRWLTVNRPADKVWESLREFWTSSGFTLSTDAPELGIMETDWAENRAKIPQDFVRRTLGKVLDGLYSTGERDRYRTRIERDSAGGVEIYISHRGMVEEFADSLKTRTVWMPRATDPELEIEFLRRLMVKLGAPKEQAERATAGGSSAGAGLSNFSLDQDTLTLSEPLDRAWRRIGLALDRSGFTVEDRDRSKGLYFVRYVPAQTQKEEPGILSRLLSSKPRGAELTRYQVQLLAIDRDRTQVRVLNQQGAPEKSENVEKILKLLAGELR